MNDDPLPRELRLLWDHELDLAHRDLPRPARPTTRRSSRGVSGAAVVMTALVAAAAVGLSLRGGVPGSSPMAPSVAGAGDASPVSTRAGEPEPSHPVATDLPQTPGPIREGVPRTFGGNEVLRGGELARWIASTTDETPFLAGGWFRKDHLVRFCPIPRSVTDVDACYSFALYDTKGGGEPLWIARGDQALDAARLSEDATRPVVLQIHTHDARCSTADGGCELRPVLLQVIWLGDPEART